MALVRLDDVLVQWGVPRDTPQRARYDQLRIRAEAAVKAWCKWDLEYVKQGVEYYDGTNFNDIVLRTPFVDMNDQIQVWLDMTGSGGQGPNPFPLATRLTQGASGPSVGDYMIVNSVGFSTKGRAKSGLLRRLTNNFLWFPSDLVWQRGAGGLSYRKPAYWPSGFGNIKVQCSWGFQGPDENLPQQLNPAPNDMPMDIQLAVTEVMTILKMTTKYGWLLSAESLGDYNYSLALNREFEFASVRQLLAVYRDTPIGF